MSTLRKLIGLSDQFSTGIITLPEMASGLLKKVEDIYSLWYDVFFSFAYVPQLMDREKWTVDSELLKVHEPKWGGTKNEISQMFSNFKT